MLGDRWAHTSLLPLHRMTLLGTITHQIPSWPVWTAQKTTLQHSDGRWQCVALSCRHKPVDPPPSRPGLNKNQACAQNGSVEEELVYEKLPKDIAERHVLLMDPILGTGNTASRAIQVSSLLAVRPWPRSLASNWLTRIEFERLFLIASRYVFAWIFWRGHALACLWSQNSAVKKASVLSVSLNFDRLTLWASRSNRQ